MPKLKRQQRSRFAAKQMVLSFPAERLTNFQQFSNLMQRAQYVAQQRAERRVHRRGRSGEPVYVDVETVGPSGDFIDAVEYQRLVHGLVIDPAAIQGDRHTRLTMSELHRVSTEWAREMDRRMQEEFYGGALGLSHDA